MVTIGVDLASQPKRTATCLIRWQIPLGSRVGTCRDALDGSDGLRSA